MKNIQDKGIWKRTVKLFASIKIPWHLYILMAVLEIVNAKVAVLYVPYLSKMQTASFEDSSVIWGYILFAALSAVVSLISAIPAFFASAIVAKRLQKNLIGHSLRLPMKSLESNATEMVSWIISDTTLADGLLTALIGFVGSAASLYMSAKSLAEIDTSMLTIVPGIVIYVIFGTWFSGRMLFLRQRRSSRASAELTAYMSEHLSFYTQIKQLHAKKDELTRGEKAINTFFKADIYQAVLTIVNNFVTGSMPNILTIIVFAMGVPMVTSGKIRMDELAAFQSFIILAYQSLNGIPGIYTDFMYYNGQLFYIAALTDAKEETYERKYPLNMEDGDIVFDNVSFGYGEDEPKILNNASFSIPRGKFTALAGVNGSGKTTVFKLIERFYTPDSGRIYFGNTDIEDIHLNDWRKNIAYVLQEPQLFDGTIRENISYGMDRTPEDSEIDAAVRIACADDFISKLPGGYDFYIGTNGSKLSGGQRQRLAIARAALSDPDYILLDEATCNLDAACERSVIDGILRLMKGRTTLMITHDMNLLKRADNIIVLADGKVEGCGTFDEVKENSPTLQRLVADASTDFKAESRN